MGASLLHFSFTWEHSDRLFLIYSNAASATEPLVVFSRFMFLFRLELFSFADQLNIAVVFLGMSNNFFLIWLELPVTVKSRIKFYNFKCCLWFSLIMLPFCSRITHVLSGFPVQTKYLIYQALVFLDVNHHCEFQPYMFPSWGSKYLFWVASLYSPF